MHSLSGRPASLVPLSRSEIAQCVRALTRDAKRAYWTHRRANFSPRTSLLCALLPAPPLARPGALRTADWKAL